MNVQPSDQLPLDGQVLKPSRTYNPSVNSCTSGETVNYRQLRLILKTRHLMGLQ